MKTMSHRGRILTALNHEEPDRVPVDLGGTTATSMFADAYEHLKGYLGINRDIPLRYEYPNGEVIRIDGALRMAPR